MITNDETHAAIDPELWALAEAVCNGRLAAEQFGRLNARLASDEEAARFYALYLRMHGLLLWHAQGAEAAQPVETTPPRVAVRSQASSISSFFADHSRFGQWVISYSAATVLTAMLLLAAWMYKISDHQPEQIVKDGQPAQSRLDALMPDSLGDKQQPSKQIFVAKITGRDNCKWQNEKLAPATNQIARGDRLALKSGLLEIVYNTGAKVILQGPCSYTVDSDRGGFLQVGKLTAKLEKMGRLGDEETRRLADSGSAINPKSQIPSQQISQSPSLPVSQSPSLFAVRTPTALVTDLGTEFGVEVNESGITKSRVYQGKVIFVAIRDGKPEDNEVTLVENQSARAEQAADGKKQVRVVVLQEKDAQSLKFVRSIPRAPQTPYSKAVLEDRPAAYWPLNEAAKVAVVRDRSGNNHHAVVYGKGELLFGRPGPLAGEQSRSIEFDGKSYLEVDQPVRTDPAKGITLEAWALVSGDKPRGHFYAIVSNRDYPQSPKPSSSKGYALFAGNGDKWQLRSGVLLGPTQDVFKGPSIVKENWTYLAITLEPTEKADDGTFALANTMYIDGKSIGVRRHKGFTPNEFRPLRIGASSDNSYMPFYFFIGRLAEIAIYDKPLNQDRVKAHWEAAKEATKIGN